MSFYNEIIERIRKVTEKDRVTNISASTALTAEITVIASVLIAVIMLRKINFILMVVAVLILAPVLLTSVPLSARLREEQGDGFSRMIFYVLMTLGIMVSIFYWGGSGV
ncbi:energy-converting hydrogenase B subunit G, EhbG [Methanothermobacter wolfeii]|uniref:Energy-converting hydrogenase B subunit G, EhbG n=1 Tax=Methanothermobacter wolfeii TaxID=145261 RepID=A0A9E7UMZ3_METWO|nr:MULTISPECIES: energy-converting hydrogenase B subunit G, EhbG [Methanothermobacter]NLM02460.1 energy-converting hydrogenase B subunit G, EhbG [Methanothermobacter wolfeii]QHN06976.1 energy-converting hydrogenase B subunit G, EhbG [Methanothermobacter sp. THM-1]UXH31567.1 energy-converting hydrogenase B subunit G, EhbG [Methanothermobacter wolfeii]SCM58449.1 Energy-converting hydrogenase B, subunit G {ECO:0000313/EMBL:ADL59212,1} [Methanothermobacter wolfeii]